VQIVLEHLTIAAASEDRVDLVLEQVSLAPGEDPVAVGFGHHDEALSHSTSWREEGGRLILTFAHVVADGTDLSAVGGTSAERWSGAPVDLEALPSACHAVRHLHFLRFTDEDIASHGDRDTFWAYAHAVADHHYPAVAGLLSTHGLVNGPDYVI